MNKKNELGLIVFSALAGFGAFLGFWASLALFLSWLVAPFVGFMCGMVFHGLNNFKAIVAISVGVVIGGLPMWYSILRIMDWSALVLFSTALIFLAGATLGWVTQYVKIRYRKQPIQNSC